jgi:hypothetical protein
MKKVFYTILFIMSTMLAVSSCTEESVDPKVENGGGGTSSTLP